MTVRIIEEQGNVVPAGAVKVPGSRGCTSNSNREAGALFVLRESRAILDV